jgi:hypothetical protein
VTDRRSTATSVFDDPRQALGWLASRWAGYLLALLVWSVLLGDRPADAARSTWWSAASTVLVLVLGVLNVWGYWVSADAGPRFREAVRERALPWWDRDRFGGEQAADRLGWARGPVVWTTRALMALAAVATVTAVPLLVVRWS